MKRVEQAEIEFREWKSFTDTEKRILKFGGKIKNSKLDGDVSMKTKEEERGNCRVEMEVEENTIEAEVKFKLPPLIRKVIVRPKMFIKKMEKNKKWFEKMAKLKRNSKMVKTMD